MFASKVHENLLCSIRFNVSINRFLLPRSGYSFAACACMDIKDSACADELTEKMTVTNELDVHFT
jgi:hypothetical protein